MEKSETIFVGLSGGVDSAVSAKRLIDRGHTVVGVFIKVWQPDFLKCNWERERLDSMRVAAHLNIPFLTFDAQDAYKKEVADYMIREYREGRTPNPDIMCNEHVKFGAFLTFALEQGADKVATGHYAQIEKRGECHALLRGKDASKDQSYFLSTLTEAQRSKIYFPIGDTNKSDVRKEAEHARLPIFDKEDSQGICFLGQVDMETFLSHYIETSEGAVLNIEGERIGTHGGAHFYTLGQRHGFSIDTKESESRPHYVIAKDIEKNTITVSESPRVLDTKNESITLTRVNRMCTSLPRRLMAQFRYRQKPFEIEITNDTNECVMLTVLTAGIEQPSAGQSCVFYDGEVCMGGGIIS